MTDILNIAVTKIFSKLLNLCIFRDLINVNSRYLGGLKLRKVLITGCVLKFPALHYLQG